MAGPAVPDDEGAFIDRLRRIATAPGARNLDDDAGLLVTSSATFVVTHDMMVEGVHWLPDQDPADVAWKLVAVNLSDLAAKGARPNAILMGYMLGTADWNERFAQGLAEVVSEYGVALLGGDTVAAPSGKVARAIGITAIGRPDILPPPARTDATPGDELWVTGVLGAALAGFEAMRDGIDDETLTQPYRRPVPLIDEGLSLAEAAHAVMDISDGLLLDARRMALASGTTIAIDTHSVPIHPAMSDRRVEALSWGDDYQLLFTMPAGAIPPVGATRIGSVLPRGEAPLILDGAPPDPAMPLGFTHQY